MWRPDRFRAETREVAVTQVVGEDKNHIWFRGDGLHGEAERDEYAEDGSNNGGHRKMITEHIERSETIGNGVWNAVAVLGSLP